MTAPISSLPGTNQLGAGGDSQVLIKILCELRLQTLLMAQDSRTNEDIGNLRNELMTQVAVTSSDL